MIHDLVEFSWLCVILADTTSVVISTMVVDSKDITYLVDSVSMTEIVADPGWRTKADERIDKLRKSSIIFK